MEISQRSCHRCTRLRTISNMANTVCWEHSWAILLVWEGAMHNINVNVVTGQTTVITEHKLKNELLADQYLQGSDHAGGNGATTHLPESSHLPRVPLRNTQPNNLQVQQQQFGGHGIQLQANHVNNSPRLIPPLHDKFAHLLADTMFCCGRRKVRSSRNTFSFCYC